MRWVLVLFASIIIVGCINNSETSKESSDGSSRVNPATPQLFTELDSIVFNQWDYAYMRNKEEMLNNSDHLEFQISARGRSMLTHDTSQFFSDSIYYSDELAVSTLFVRTKFTPKGWDAFIDRKNDIGCKVVIDLNAPEQQDWLVKSALDDSTFMLCKENTHLSQTVNRLQPIYYINIGFSFDFAGPIGGYDGGKVRIYYWR